MPGIVRAADAGGLGATFSLANYLFGRNQQEVITGVLCWFTGKMRITKVFVINSDCEVVAPLGIIITKSRFGIFFKQDFKLLLEWSEQSFTANN